MRALIVEDELALRERIVKHLQSMGWAVDSAADGTEGQWMGDEYPLDVAVVDLGLPGINGLDVIKHWRVRDKRFPVLILTARDRWQDKVEGLEAGAACGRWFVVPRAGRKAPSKSARIGSTPANKSCSSKTNPSR
jgi:two-component system response regulator PhoP